ncbi:diaminopimelate decarboxylase [Clostridiales bacterium AM23-16LB]|nr:diaminopimelate decarboxylase [Clostridiales bacterium AM23-16LB]RHR46294.1 diaminopimelate decarboxylase [Clostridiaceae bacterium AF18-31LB]
MEGIMQSESYYIDIKRDQADNLKTPCYILDIDRFEENLANIKNPFEQYWNQRLILGFSFKTNHMKELIQCAKKNGMYAETVSDDEYNLALELGYSPEKIIYNGPQKSEKQLIEALKNGSIVNLDNLDEISIIEKMKEELDTDSLKVGMRVNFNLEAMCPGETTAGMEASRFGFCVENGDFESALNRLRRIGIKMTGLHLHYSSRTRSQEIFHALAETACYLIDRYQLHKNLQYIDIGGGLFGGKRCSGKPSMQEYADVISSVFKDMDYFQTISLIIEPGASLIATSIDYLSRVINVRDVRGTQIVTVDGSNLHINPFMSAREPDYELMTGEKKLMGTQIVCGATCMENDRILRLKDASELRKGDYIHCFCAGAYTMGFNNCFINLPPYIYVKKNGDYSLKREKNVKLQMFV